MFGRELTLSSRLRHDGMAQRKEAEELLGVGISLPHVPQEVFVVEDEVWVGHRVRGEVNPTALGLKLTKIYIKLIGWGNR